MAERSIGHRCIGPRRFYGACGAHAATRFELTQTHKSIGVSILVLTVVRLWLRCVMRSPKPEPASRSVTIVAKAVHVGLYILLLLLPLSGWLMVTSTPVRDPDRRLRSVRSPVSAGSRHCALPLGACRAYCAGGCAYRARHSSPGSGARSCLGLARPHARPYVVAGRLSVVIRVTRIFGSDQCVRRLLVDWRILRRRKSIKADEARTMQKFDAIIVGTGQMPRRTVRSPRCSMRRSPWMPS